MAFEFNVHKTTRGPLPRVPFGTLAKKILGEHYSLSLVVCGDSLATALNKKYRKKSYSPNVLSFPYAKDEGEILLNLQKTKREAREFNVSLNERAAFLFIHACLHLKGHAHGKKMDQLEAKYLKIFSRNSSRA
ncbi:rRNA maturation RNase YbeY [Candidatus Kaiserbacteria bacterium]|nr:rRNA maturation RNase YbeY [Candidatus Kaiserbacteria bacterium]